jgi:hypothetical protein
MLAGSSLQIEPASLYQDQIKGSIKMIEPTERNRQNAGN